MRKDENVVAVLDILGYSQLMERYAIDEMQQLIVNGLLSTVNIAQLISGEAIAVGKNGELQEMSLLLGIDYGVISDTIVLFPRSTTRNPLTTLCSTVAVLMTELLKVGLVLRGAIDVDTFRAIEGHTIYIGKAVIGAHKLEVSQEWAGCALSRRVGKKFPKEFSSLRKSGLVMSYPIPFKKKFPRSTEQWVVNWFYYQLGDQIEKVNTLIKLRNEAPDHARDKLVATIEFWKYLNERGLNWCKPVSKLLVDRSQVGGPYTFAPL